ncbi:MAG TPA: metal-dependent hydrolase [Haliangium sp.]|nr:metal-dependent hydrolase [Haliangium sp.]
MAADTSNPATRPVPRPRRMDVPFSDDIPRHWYAGLALPTHVTNAVNLLFPAGERFFVRTLKHYLPDFQDDPEMLAQIRGFLGQEGHHAREHERFFAVLEAQGYRVRELLERYERVTYDIIEQRMPMPLRLASTAACEHFTAILAEFVLAGDALAHAHPVMRELLTWHAAEEIEHKAVAFDVLQRMHPSYALRLLGLACATSLLGLWWFVAARALLAQDGVTRAQVRDQRARMTRVRGRRHAIWRHVFLRGILEYARPGFHPWNRDDRHLAEAYLARLDQSGAR